MEKDPGIALERLDLKEFDLSTTSTGARFEKSGKNHQHRFIPLVIVSNSFRGDHRTAELLAGTYSILNGSQSPFYHY